MMRSPIVAILLGVLCASWLYWVCAWIATRRFFRRSNNPLPDFKPSVSILKPVKGVDAQAFKNFASFCQQHFDNYELLFGVADGNDPAVALVEQLQKEFPDRRIAL